MAQTRDPEFMSNRIIDQDSEPLKEFIRSYGEAPSNPLRVVEFGHSDSPRFFIKGGFTGTYFRCTGDEKLRLEIGRWCEALHGALRDEPDWDLLRRMSPTLDRVHLEHDARRVREHVIVRALRMVLLFEALCLPEEYCASDNPYRSEVAAIRGQNPELAGLFSTCATTLKAAKHGLGSGQCRVGLTLLLLLVLSESQSEHLQDYAWEAYTAGRFRDALYRDWHGLAGEVSNHDLRMVIDTAATLIRCQSFLGQKVRKSGGDAFLHIIGWPGPCRNLAFSPDERLAALRLIAVISEARNHKVPADSNGRWRGIDIDSGIVAVPVWQREKFSNDAVLYLNYEPPKPNAGPEPTYAYWRPNYVGLDDDSHSLDRLKEFVTETRREMAGPDYRMVALGEGYTMSPLRELLCSIVTKVPEDASAGKDWFDRYFTCCTITLPDSFSAKRGDDRTLCIKLREELIGERYLFPDGDITALLERWKESREIGQPAGEGSGLFEYLLERAKSVCEPEGDFWDGASYLPLPMVRRIADIVYRLQPDACFSIPVKIDDDRTRWIHIPRQVPRDHEETKQVIANLIMGIIENRAMAAGMQFADVDLENLGDDRGSDPSSSRTMGPGDWTRLIEDTYRKGGYETLLGRYLRDYNTRPRSIRFISRATFDHRGLAGVGLPGRLHRAEAQPSHGIHEILTLGSVRERLLVYLNAHTAGESPQPSDDPGICLIGIDIGGTLTKCQCYWFGKSGKGPAPQFVPIGEAFRMKTGPGGTPGADDALDPGARIRRRAEDFASRLVRLLDTHRRKYQADILGHHLQPCRCVEVICGLSWPGPVRDGRVAGTSGILKHFPPLGPSIADNAPENIAQIEIADSVAAALRSKWADLFAPSRLDNCESGTNSTWPRQLHVRLLNDGDSEAVGAIVEREVPGPRAGGRRVPTRIAVVKLGTGLAGGLLAGSAGDLGLANGLFEWGKLILDLGAPQRTGFPRGVAGEYLSVRALRRLAERRGRGERCFQNDDPEPDGAEIGLILDLFKAKAEEAYADIYQRLIIECGVTQAERRPLHGIPFETETLRTLSSLSEDRPPQPSALDDEQYHLAVLASERPEAIEEKAIVAQLRSRLNAYGLERLRLMVDRQNRRSLVTSNRAIGDASYLKGDQRFENAGRIAEKSVKVLGRYLGDFCVLLFDELDVTHLILAGGVLSGRTRTVAIEAARARIGQYGLEMTAFPDASGQYELYDPRLRPGAGSRGETSKTEGNDTANREDTRSGLGMLGAAGFAAASFIQMQRHEGLRRLRALLLSRPAGCCLTIVGTEVREHPTSKASGQSEQSLTEDLSRYALTHPDLLKFLEDHGWEWGYYRLGDGTTSDGAAGDETTPGVSFGRWLVRDETEGAPDR